MKDIRQIECLGYSIFADELTNIPASSKLLINTINQYSYCIAQNDVIFKEALKESDVLLPDGVGITFAAKFLNNQRLAKIAGADVHQFLLEKLNEEKGSCFYLGASQSTLVKIKDKIKLEHPNIKVATYSPPFKAIFTAADTKLMIDKVNVFQPDVLFVGMTAPKQEKWAAANKNELECNLICSIGAVFDFYAGTVKRPSKVWISLGLEWLGRLLKEPKRMFKRYIYYGVIYVFYLAKEKCNSWLGKGRNSGTKQAILGKKLKL